MKKLDQAGLTMKADSGGDQSSTGGRGRKRDCGYRYMTPSYVEEGDAPDSYLVVSDALLENSSAHGLPTFYQARGLSLRLFYCAF